MKVRPILYQYIPLSTVLHIAVSVCSLIVASYISIPFVPVPFTLQTFASTAIALTLPPGQSFLAVLSWITLAACGAPVFSGGAGPAVFLGPTGGYLWGILLSSLFISYGRRFCYGFWWRLALVVTGHAFILGLGFLQLSLFVLDYASAFSLGVTPFILGEALKIWIVFGMIHCFKERQW